MVTQLLLLTAIGFQGSLAKKPDAPNVTKTFTIDATQGVTHTGMLVAKGDHVQADASGSAYWGSGARPYTADNSGVFEAARAIGLRIGDKGKADFSDLQYCTSKSPAHWDYLVQQSGEICIIIADPTTWDNVGTYHVSVTAPRQPTECQLQLRAPDFTDRMRATVARLKPKAIELGKEKEGLEKDVLDGVALVNRDEAALKSASEKRHALAQLARALRTNLNALQVEEAKVPGVSGLLDQESQLVRRLATQESKPSDPAAEKHIATLSKQLNAVRELIHERIAGSPVAEMQGEWSRRVADLTSKSADVLQAEESASENLLTATSDLEAKREALRKTDESLLEVAKELSVFEPSLDAIQASADGSQVYAAKAAERVPIKEYLDAEIDRFQSQIIPEMRNGNKAAFESYVASAKKTIAAGYRLAKALKDAAYVNYFAELASQSFDLCEAFLKGGFVGLGVEIAKKGIEAYMLSDAPNSVAPGSPEDEVNQLFDAGLKDNLTAPGVATVAYNRLWKESAIKFEKDTFNEFIGKNIFDYIEAPIRLKLSSWAVQAGSAATGRAANYARTGARLASLLKKSEELGKGYSYFQGSGKAAKAAAKGVLKDAVKLLVKGGMDKIVKAAAENYYQALLVEKTAYPVYRAGLVKLVDANEALEGLELQRAQMLEGLPQQPHLTTNKSAKFMSDQRLLVTLKLTGRQSLGWPFEVYVGGVRAQRQGNSDNYAVDVSAAVTNTEGKLDLVVK